MLIFGCHRKCYGCYMMKIVLLVLNYNVNVIEKKIEKAKTAEDYRKVPKFLDARNLAVNHLKFKQRGKT